MGFFHVLQNFFRELRGEGIPVTASQVEDCCRALLMVNWLNEEYFYTALYSTLVKDNSHQTAFNEVYRRCFYPGFRDTIEPKWYPPVYRDMGLSDEISGYAADALPVHGMQSLRGGQSQSLRNPLDQTFSLADLDDVRKMESLFPIIAKRLAARMIKKNQLNDQTNINYRKTMRQSMSSGGIPLELITQKRYREKPIVIAICDISGSVMTFSCFALAMLASMQRFFRQLRTFAFIEQIEEITPLLRLGDPLNLRNTVLNKARGVMGSGGYTDYGSSFKGFIKTYEGILSHKTTVLIFGDARNNWFNDETWALQEIKTRAKRVYWFNPEPESSWQRGDSRMYNYLKYCDRYFSCPNMSKLERAIGQL
jgi:hypothetical protein